MLCPVIKERSEYLKSEGGKKYMFKLFAEDIEKAREEERKKAEIEIEKVKKEAEEKAKIEIENAKKEARKAEKQAKQAKQQGKLEGMAEAIINNIKSLMETMNVTAEKAMKALKIPQEEQEFYLAQLRPNTP